MDRGLGNGDVARPVISEDILYAACLDGEIMAAVMIKTLRGKLPLLERAKANA